MKNCFRIIKITINNDFIYSLMITHRNIFEKTDFQYFNNELGVILSNLFKSFIHEEIITERTYKQIKIN